MKRNAIVMMLMIMLIVTHVECNSPSQDQEHGPTELKGVKRVFCEIKCTMSCRSLRRIAHKYKECFIDCVNKKCIGAGKNKKKKTLL
ncbi:Thionin related (TAP1) [Medicago truncatula]|uniref:Thionin related (TAP1) n=1 Tax=Medicago truncatula TaxID=3880 RepID=A0A072V534_MEDTR|nr:Thionin related (TAP1) [Medicago truncatula]